VGVIVVGDVEVVMEVGVGSVNEIVVVAAVAAENAVGYNVAFGHVVVVVRELQVS
jgi:hypothetical protein